MSLSSILRLTTLPALLSPKPQNPIYKKIIITQTWLYGLNICICISIEESSDVSKLSLEFVIVWAEFEQKSLIILTVDHVLWGDFSCFETIVVLTTSPGDEVSSRGELWSPACGEEWIILSLQGSFHLDLILNCWYIKVESAIFHEGSPHQSSVLIISGNSKSRGWHVCWGVLSIKLHLLSKRLSLKGFLLSNLSLDLSSKFLVEENVLSVLLELFTMLCSVKHIFY